ncbi:hypothetical protein [Streptomyces sp. NPDC000134]|uniref:hypothetical protein n=1 Tax=Streptomyces sp. NPDC000134 TaxID=3364536 RepID=UPI0036BC09F6
MPVLLLFLAVAVVTALVLARRGTPYPAAPAAPAARTGPRRPGARLRVLAGCAGAAAVLLYLWGALCVAWAVMEAEDDGAGSAPMLPCRIAGHPERAARTVDYSVSWLPLDFRCETADGESYAPGSVPGYVNPGTAALALTAAAGAVAAGYTAQAHARSAARDRP